MLFRVYRIGFCFRIKFFFSYMTNWTITIEALNCFEELISRINFVKLTLKTIYEEWTFTNNKAPNQGGNREQRRKTQQRGRTQCQAKRTKHKVGHKATKWILYIACCKTSILKTRDNLDKVCITIFVWWVKRLFFNKKKTCLCFNCIVAFVVNRLKHSYIVNPKTHKFGSHDQFKQIAILH